MLIDKYTTLFCIVLLSSIVSEAQIIDTIIVGKTNVFYAVQPNPILTYTWEVEDGTIVLGQGSSAIAVDWNLIPGIKKMQVYSNSFGSCYSDTSIAYVLLVENEEIFIPNSFTPNGDGLNDNFKPILNVSQIKNYQFSITNRWGEIIFQTNNPDDYWTGKDRDGNLQFGVFICQISLTKINNKEFYYKKLITIFN